MNRLLDLLFGSGRKIVLRWWRQNQHVDLPEAKSWTQHLDTLWLTPCDRCGKRRIVAQFMEMYGDENWWRECVWCAIHSIAGIKAMSYGQEMEPLLIYIAGPYTPKDMSNIDVAQRELEENVRDAVEAATEVIRRGHIPFIPHTHTQGFALRTLMEQHGDTATQFYYSWDDVILARCDAIYRFASSPGADNEYDLAGQLGLLRFDSAMEIPQCLTSARLSVDHS